MENKVTLGLEEYLELRELRDKVLNKAVFIYQELGSYGYNFQVYSDNEAIKNLAKINEELSNKLGEATETILKLDKRRWWQRKQ